ncbi:MAG: dihydroorotase [Oscillospiraceae bacterium]|nr:dihydroorotase [Oscillospiraceae bacterium]
MSKLLVRGGRVIDPANNLDGACDLLIEDGLVAAVAERIDAPDAQAVDAAGLLVLPGLVDIHCHLREPGYEYKEDIASGTRAAAAGGFTSVCCMANTHPVNDCAAVTAFIRQQAGRVGSGVRVYPIGAVTKGLDGAELAEIGEMKAAGAVAVSDDGRPVRSGRMLRLALQYADYFDLPVLCHSEDMDLVDGGVMNEGEMSTRLGLRGATRAAEEAAVARDILIAEALGKRVHICHVSTQGSVQLIRDAKARGARVTAETAPHYLAATDAWVAQYDPNTRVNPPLRTEQDRLACIAGLADGALDCIATDHAPHHADEKKVEYLLAASGISGFETAFALCWTHLVEASYLTPGELVRRMTCAPAAILGLPGGTLSVGAPGDVVLIDPAKRWVVDPARFQSKGKNTPFVGNTYTGCVRRTYVAGRPVWGD